jgi:hypothetical protein
VNGLIVWVSFLGAWLLVAGPLYQGAVELSEFDFDREAIMDKVAAAKAERDRPSLWWWLLPPVMYVLHRQWYKATQRAVMAQLSETHRGQVVRFQSKATGWFAVAGGAGLLAAGETWQAVRHYHWSAWLFWLILVVMLAVSVIIPTALVMTGPNKAYGGN